MNYQPTTTEQHVLWMLIANSGEAFLGDLKLKVNPGVRESLVRTRLIEVEKRQRPSSRRRVQSIYLRLTDAGWAWCNRDMSWQKPRGNGEKLLNALLQRLKVLFERPATVSSLADFINNSTPAALDGRIRAACLELGGGRDAVRIRIADLRKRLADVPNVDLTEGIRELSRRRELTLYPLDDPRQITPEDEAAAIQSSTGVPQHILYYGGIAS